ncbi:adenosylcobinamide-GDP ribazoletransferase [Sphingomonas sp. QA11]|uniref:adenosylcobinamide-GDP ribazoletransferase n=1 Tax=Sphingomonas sp. QA11 TaxID=2950605 RepID=UPI00234B5463|nr:adenosylcobinamide-GDP ribazoletransferase [Sphingomonas sp. QA11]WCM25542.1 adenosylcobinamide-GDP ribazoletransferase [Sphingomonas sp. QA11]
MKRLIVAFGFLTRLPMPQIATDGDDFAAAIRCYPLVGLVVGGLVALAGWAGGMIDPWLGALAALLVWVAVTGALHLDGLADLADACGAAHRDRERLLAVMADPHIGSFGVVAIVLQLLAKLVLLHGITGYGWGAVALIPFAARIGPLAWARWLPPLKAGLGAVVAGAVRTRDLIGWALLLCGVVVFAPALAATPLLILGWGLWLKRRIGGVTGDCHGAGIELVETALLSVLVIAGRF